MDDKEFENCCDHKEDNSIPCEQSADCSDENDLNNTGCTTDKNHIQNCSNNDKDFKINELLLKVDELKDLYTRSQAEMQNQQRRHFEDIKKNRDYAIYNFSKELIQVKDFLEMAINDNSNDIETIKNGVSLTLKELIKIFDNNKIKEILPNVNDKLDPHSHQAISIVNDSNQEKNTIVSVMQKGYILNERILRPAMVNVAK